MDPPPAPLLPQLHPSHRCGSWSLGSGRRRAATVDTVAMLSSTSACHSGRELAATMLSSTSACHPRGELAAAVVDFEDDATVAVAVAAPCHAEGSLLWLWLRPGSRRGRSSPSPLFCALRIGVPRFSSLSPLNSSLTLFWA